LVQLGDHDRALDLLGRWSVRVGSDMHDWLRQDIDLDPLRDDECFKTLLAGLPCESTPLPANI
jgi:hypothetical protein